MALAVYFHERFLEHDAGAWHPEAPARLIAARSALAASDLPLVWREPRPATVEEIARVHTVAYIEGVERLADRGGGAIDMDTSVSPASYEAATLAAGAGVEAVERAQREGERAFLLVRPPGHHALRGRGMGFCLFNNTALGARYLQQRHGLKRILVVDIDAHHGNGTQAAFFDTAAVLCVSIHQFPVPAACTRLDRAWGPASP